MSHFQGLGRICFHCVSREGGRRGGAVEKRGIKKSRRRRTDRAGSSNKEWRYKNALQQRLTTGCANLQTYEEKMAGAQSSSPLRQPLHDGHHSVMNVTTQVLWCNFTVKLKVFHLNSR